MSLLTIVQAVQGRVKLDTSSIVATATDATASHLFALANEAGDAISKRASWQALVKEQTFSAVAAEEQTDALPTDWGGRFVNESFWNRTRQRRLIGPLTPNEWQAQKATTASTIFDSFRVRGGALLILPTATAGDTYAYEYVSTQWARATGGDPQTAFLADTDYTVFDEELLKLDIRWRWKRDNELDYAEDFRLSETAIADAIARDGSKRTLSLGGQPYEGPRVPGVQEGSWSL
jgi:hypothetical protein